MSSSGSLGINAGVSMNKLKSRILNPAQTSIYSVLMNQPALFPASAPQADKELLELTCVEASLPGSSIATVETARDFHGIVERHAYSRLYDETIDLTFLVTYDSNYLQIRFFDYWMKFIVGENELNDRDLAQPMIQRARFVDDYKTSMTIVKFEKDMGHGRNLVNDILEYHFVDAYPKAMNTIPVTYDASQLLKVTVSMNYTRFFITNTKSKSDPSYSPSWAKSAFSPGNPDVPAFSFGDTPNLNIVNTDASFNLSGGNLNYSVPPLKFTPPLTNN